MSLTRLKARSSTKVLSTFLILEVVTLGFFLFIPVESSAQVTPDQWLNWANIAWKYYQPGVGVNSIYGIDRAALNWDAVTDWDTGGYILAIIYAHRLGIIGYDGAWGFYDRTTKILNYLKTRELTTNTKNGIPNWPYWAYYWDGRPLYNPEYPYSDWSDSGRLLYALDILRKYDPTFEKDVNQIFNRCKSAYDAMAKELPVSYYGYLSAKGFEAFGYDVTSIISSFENWSGGYTEVEGQMLPSMATTSEPIVHGLLELGLSGNFAEFGRRIYETQKARFSSTGKLTAWSEGGYYPNPGYIYEWILSPPDKWVIKAHDGSILNIKPLMYSKIAFAFLALYGENEYTLALIDASKGLIHDQYGFGQATFENGTSAIYLWEGAELGFYVDKTNQIVLAAAAYAIYGNMIYSLSASTNELAIMRGEAGQVNLNIDLLIGYSSTVSLTLLGLPNNVGSYAFTALEGKPSFTSQLTIIISANAPIGDYTLTIKSIGAGLERKASLILHVQNMPLPLSDVGPNIISAPPRSVYVVLPDYGRGVEYPSHTPKPKGNNVMAALSTDIFASAYILGSFDNGQFEVLDTDGNYISTIDPIGKPLFGSEHAIFTVASFWVNTLVKYYDQTGQTLVYITYTEESGVGYHRIIERATGQVLAEITNGERDKGLRDYFVIQSFTDNDGHKVFMVWGVGWKGTYAGAVYFVRYILPNIDTYANSWYVYEWREATTGQSVNSIPDGGDTYSLVSQG